MSGLLKRGCTDDASDEVVDGHHLSLILGQKNICSRTALDKRENHSCIIEGGGYGFSTRRFGTRYDWGGCSVCLMCWWRWRCVGPMCCWKGWLAVALGAEKPVNGRVCGRGERAVVDLASKLPQKKREKNKERRKSRKREERSESGEEGRREGEAERV
jgi:hypothetical protein